MPDDIQFILGQMAAGIKTLTDNQEKYRQEQREDNTQIFNKINDLAANGCAIGKQHAKDIDELKKRPERIVGFAATMVAIVSAIWSTLMSRGGIHD